VAPTADQLDPANDPIGEKKMKWQLEMKQYVSAVQAAVDKKPMLFATLISQISSASEERVKAHPDYVTKANVNGDKDLVELAIIIRDIHNGCLSMNASDRRRKAKEYYHGLIQIDNQPLLVFKDKVQAARTSMAAAKCIEAQASEEEFADDFIHKVNQKYYGSVVATLDRNRILGIGGFPKTVDEAYTLLTEWHHEPRVSYNTSLPSDTVFKADMRIEERKPSSKRDKKSEGDKGVKSNTECNNCGKKGHIAKDCWSGKECNNCGKKGHLAKDCWGPGGAKEGQKPSWKKGNEEVHFTDLDFECYSADCAIIENCDIFYNGNDNDVIADEDFMVYIDNCATNNLIRNRHLVTNIQKGPEVRIHPITSGTKSIMMGNLWGNLPHIGKVHYNPRGRGNILSEGRLKQHGSKIIRDDSTTDKIIVKTPSGAEFIFIRPANETRWFCDFSKRESMFVATVEQNMMKYSKREVERAKLAREMQEALGFPTAKVMVDMVKGHINNCPITAMDIARADDIWGRHIAEIKGKTTQRSSGPPVEEEFNPRRLNPEVQELLVDYFGSVEIGAYFR
jgi:hypothetical protein